MPIFIYCYFYGITTLFADPGYSKDKEPSLSTVSRKLSHVRLNWIENKNQLNGEVAYYTKIFSGTVFITNKEDLVYSIPLDSLSAFPICESFVHARRQQITAEGLSGAEVHSFIGNDPSKWQSHVRTFETVSLGELWDGITVKLNAYGNNIEKLFLVSPYADPSAILMKIVGAKKLSLNRNGELR